MLCQGKILSITIDQNRYYSISGDIVSQGAKQTSCTYYQESWFTNFTSENYLHLYEEKPQSFEWWNRASDLKS